MHNSDLADEPPVYHKGPDEMLDYPFKWDDWLEEGEQLADADFTVPIGLTLVDEVVTATAAVPWLGGGTVGERYRVLCQIATNNVPARVAQRSCIIKIVAR